MALPSLYTEGTTASNLPLNSLNNQYILELVLTAHIVQVMLLYDRSQGGEEGEGWVLGVLTSVYFLWNFFVTIILKSRLIFNVVKSRFIFNACINKWRIMYTWKFGRIYYLYIFLILWLISVLVGKIWISGGMEMENDADSVALMSMFTEIRRKAGYETLVFDW